MVLQINLSMGGTLKANRLSLVLQIPIKRARDPAKDLKEEINRMGASLPEQFSNSKWHKTKVNNN